jgi:hypothetical protein
MVEPILQVGDVGGSTLRTNANSTSPPIAILSSPPLPAATIWDWSAFNSFHCFGAVPPLFEADQRGWRRHDDPAEALTADRNYTLK